MRCLALLVSLTACKASLGEGMDDAGLIAMGDSAAGSVDAMPDGPPALPPWAPPTVVPITPVGDDDPTLTGDMLELYFNRNADIFVTRRATTADAWGTPTAVTELNTTATETTPEVSSDGLTIYFASGRMPTLGGNDIWMATRASRTAAWGAPVHVTALSSTAADGSPALADPLTIVIDSDRGGAPMLDLYIATRPTPTAAWSAPTALDDLNGAQSDGDPMLSSDKLAIYFDSNRGGNAELYVATRATPTSTFSPAAQITELTSTSLDNDPWISPDGRTMYFMSSRDGTQRLWQTTR